MYIEIGNQTLILTWTKLPYWLGPKYPIDLNKITKYPMRGIKYLNYQKFQVLNKIPNYINFYPIEDFKEYINK